MKVFILGILGIFLSASVAFAADCTERFSWLPNADSDIAGYKIHYGLTNGGPYPNAVDVVNDALTDGRILGVVPNLVCDESYYFVATAYNSAGMESAFSPQVDLFVTAPVSGEGGEATEIFGSGAGADYIGAIEDTFINLNTENNIAGEQLNTYTWPDNKVANAILMKIDLSHLPEGAQIQSAILELYATGAGGDEVFDISIHKVIHNNPDLSATTGYTFDGINGWTDNTDSYSNIPMAQADISAAENVNGVDMSAGYKNWDITNMAQSWLTDPASNYGLLLNSDTIASADSYRTFAASEAIDANQRPRLVVTYTTLDPRPIIWSISLD